MDNNELDKILKEKLKDKIKPSMELESKIKQKVEDEKIKKLKSMKIENKNIKDKYKKMKLIISMAAVVLIALVVGANFDTISEFNKTTVTVATIKSIEPTKALNGIVQSDSEFLIYAENTNVEAVQKSLYVEPALDYTIKKENDNLYKLTFKQNIPDNIIVKLQYVKNKITEDSWAYQTSNKLSVSSTYPENNATSVSKNTVIDIKFSYANIENLETNVEILPVVEGKWEHLGKIWRFIPAKELDEQKYTIIVKKGIKAENEILEEDYIFSFNVENSSNNKRYSHVTTTIDEIENSKPDELVKIHYNINTYVESSEEISKIEIRKFKTVDEFIQYIKTKDYKNSENLGEYKFSTNKNYLQLNNSLQIGYYVAIIKNQNNEEIFNCPVQINDLSAYAIQTERDIITWVAKGDNLAENISVQYLDKQEKTNKQGIAQFEDVLDGTQNIKYLKIGNSNAKLVVGIYNYEQNNFPRGYIYTDRPLYKNTDTINIWGFISRQLFYDEIDENSFYIQLGNEERQKVSIDENGVFNYKIELKNHIDDEYSNISLYYKEQYIASRQIAIQNYELQNYTYNVIMDKNFGYEGEMFEFKVKVEHITGLAVPNKAVVIKYDNNTYREMTDENGIVKCSIKLKESQYESSYPTYSEISICNGDTVEYTESEEYVPIYILNSNTKADVKTVDVNKYEVTLYELDTKKETKINYDLQDIYKDKYNTNIRIDLIEIVMQKQINDYTYNEYTKENEPNYIWNEIGKNINTIDTISTRDGKIELDANKINFKQDTEELSYRYELEFVYNDANNKQIKERQYISRYSESQDENEGYTYWLEFDQCGIGNIPVQINEGAYYTYRYLLKKDVDKFSIGDTVKFNLAESTQNGIKDINNSGKILRLILKEDITQMDIIENDNLNYTFSEKDFPGCGITSAYFINGKFYRMPIYYFDFKEEDRNVDVEIIADKEQYKPGDTVTLTVKTTNKGNPIKSVVNISVANKAVFELYEDSTEILSEIYEDKNYKVYTYSTYKDYINYDGGGAGGGGGEARGDFGDTACFETVETDSKGNATISFKLPDNVTTYTVTAHSANKNLYVGVNKLDIISKLDFFIQSTEPRNVKTSDDLVLNATSISEENYNVKYEFTIKELNKTLITEGNTNSIATVNFGKLPYGTYNVIIKGQHDKYEDSIEYKINIIESAQEVKNKQTVKITEKTTIRPTKNPIVLEIYNEKMEQYVKYIEFIEETLNERLDTQISYNKVQGLKEKYYNTQNVANYINIDDYITENSLKNLKNAKGDLILTALVSKYDKQYYNEANDYIDSSYISEDTNIFEVYLLAAANNEPVLTDLLYLKDAEDISNYNKLLVTLSLEFLGDYQNAKELYEKIRLTDEEKKEYKSIIALIDTYINKEEAVIKINELIENRPEDEYLRFAILSFFENNSVEMEKEETVKIISENINETITINGLQVKTYMINNEELKTIKFETESKELMVSYYYQTLLDNIESKNISKDIKMNLNGDLQTGNIVKLTIEFNNDIEGEVRIALPNSLRLNTSNYDYNKYYLMSNQIDYITFYKKSNCTRMDIPLIVSSDGEYKFENIVCNYNGIYHISNTIDFEVVK